MLTLFAGIGFAALLIGVIFVLLRLRYGERFFSTWAGAAAGFAVAALAFDYRASTQAVLAVMLGHAGLLVGAGLLWVGVRQLRHQTSRAWLIAVPAVLHSFVVYLAGIEELSLEARRVSWNLFGAGMFFGLAWDAWRTKRTARGWLPALDLLIASAAAAVLRFEVATMAQLRHEAPDLAWHLLTAVALQTQQHLRQANVTIAGLEAWQDAEAS